MRTTVKRKSVTALAGAVLGVILQAGPGLGQNLLSNGKFDSGTSGWQAVSEVTLVYDALHDADDAADSGSALLSNHSSTDYALGTLRQCSNDVTLGTQYYLSGRIRYQPGETRTGYARLVATFYSQANCKGTSLNQVFGALHPPSEGRGVWFDSNAGDITSGVKPNLAAKSVLLSLLIVKNEKNGTLSANVDRIFFAPVGLPLCQGMRPTIGGSDGPDVIRGTAGPDVIVGLDGDDVIAGRGGDDVICGGAGDDVLKGGPGSDLLDGGPGDDVLRGGPRFDVLFGDTGFDSCNGGAGSDENLGGCEVTSSVP